MSNLKLKILEYANARPHLTIGGLADAISPEPRTEQQIRDLVKKGYLLNRSGFNAVEQRICLHRFRQLQESGETGRQVGARRCRFRSSGGDKQVALEPDSIFALVSCHASAIAKDAPQVSFPARRDDTAWQAP